MIRDRGSKTKASNEAKVLAEAMALVKKAEKDAEKEAARAADKAARREQGSVLYRCRRQLSPHAIAGGLLGTAWLTEVTGWATGASGIVNLTAVAVGGITAVTVARRARKQERAWVTLCAGVAQGWLSLAVLDDVTWSKVALLAAAEYLLAARWWRKVRIPDPEQKPTEFRFPAKTAAPVLAAGDVVAMWEQNVGCTGGPLAGSKIIDTDRITAGAVYTVQLVPGQQTLDSAHEKIKMIASGLRQPIKHLVIEDHPEIEDPSVILVKVITRSPVTTKSAFFEKPKFEKGRVHLGPYVDGEGEATWKVVIPKRIVNGMVTGGPGSGKSRLLEGLALTAMDTGFLHVVHLDGQAGASCPSLWHAVKHKAGPDDVDGMLRRIIGWGTARQKVLRKTVSSGFRPTPDYPGILIIADEFHGLCNKGNVDLWAMIAREYNKVGIGTITGDQDGSLTTYLKDVLRFSLQAGNNLGLRTASRQQGQILAHGKVNLHDLPEIPGFTQVLSPGERQAPFRNRWLPDQDDRDLGEAGEGPEIPGHVTLIEEWFQRVKQVDIDAFTTAGGDARVSAWMALKDKKDKNTATSAADVPAVPVRPTVSMPPVPAPVPAPAPAPSDERLLAALGEGTKTPAELAAVVKVSTRQIHNLLNKLQDNGKVRKVDDGRYALVPVAVAS